jgi:hypothetical protein
MGDPSLGIANIPDGSFVRETENERRVREAKKERLLLCHAAAADFYGKALITLPAAGQARAHLRSRASLQPLFVPLPWDLRLMHIFSRIHGEREVL